MLRGLSWGHLGSWFPGPAPLKFNSGGTKNQDTFLGRHLGSWFPRPRLPLWVFMFRPWMGQNPSKWGVCFGRGWVQSRPLWGACSGRGWVQNSPVCRSLPRITYSYLLHVFDYLVAICYAFQMCCWRLQSL